MLFHQEKIADLIKSAINTSVPGLNHNPEQGWQHSNTPIFGSNSSTKVLNKFLQDISSKRPDALFDCIEKLNKKRERLVEDYIQFITALGRYRDHYENMGSPVSWPKPDDLGEKYRQAISHLEKTIKQLKVMALQPAMTFAAVTHPEYVADPENSHPAQNIFQSYAQEDNLRHIMGYAGFYTYKFPKLQESQEADSQQEAADSAPSSSVPR
ncbi:hypothetical protein [Legionella gresilensis]|uniref:hypothetical protein n=1 Tax=Legionella gresilensis TaxID=91823 RepID=UPI001041BA16|nr:hypothetical protein [Legionella gresilensis]